MLYKWLFNSPHKKNNFPLLLIVKEKRLLFPCECHNVLINNLIMLMFYR